MEIVLGELLDDIEYIAINEYVKIDTEQNLVIFGSNGIGKTTIYHKLKNQYKDFDYLDYDETRDLFKKNRKKIELSLGVNELEELSIRIKQLDEVLSTQNKLKQKKITSKPKAQEISVKLGEKYGAKEFTKIEMTDEEFKEIAKVDKYIQFIISNFSSLKEINDITEELKLVDQNYLKKALLLLEPKVNDETKFCPVCNSPIHDLKSIIKEKISTFSKIKNECLIKFMKEYEFKLNDENIQKEFLKILKSVESINEENIIDYFIIDGNLEMVKAINNAVKEKASLIKEYEECLRKQEELFNSLIEQKEMYTDYLMNNFEASVEFDNDKKTITINFERNVDTFSTGEINLILFITKLFSFLGSEKKLLVIDDPISSYDLVNQYHIVFHLCKIITTNSKHVVIFTHNPDVVNIINSQNTSAYQYFFFDKVDGKIIMNSLPEDMKSSANVLFIDNLTKDKTIEANKYLSLMVLRNDENTADILSSVLHYDDSYITLGEDCGDFKGCTNKYFINYIEDNTYLNDLENIDFETLCRTKIIALTSIRVWVEYKLQQLSSVRLHGLYSNKVNKFFKKNKGIRTNYPRLTKEQLMNKKVMLNQNCHGKSQVQPFYYALSIKADDIKKEVEEIKSLFGKI